MQFLLSPERRRFRAVWADPGRKLRTLESFSKTEADGGRDIRSAARKASDPELRMHLERHAADEVRHAQMFRERALVLREGATAAASSGESDRLFDFGAGRTDIDGHGFLRAGLFDELGEIAYVAMLHVAECRAAELFAMHRDLSRPDMETSAVFEAILKDEKYHVAYTGSFLAKWKKQGRGKEVSAGLTAARGSRWLGAWKRAGLRMGAHFSRTLLMVLYATILAPLGLASRYSRQPKGWRAPSAIPLDVHSQY
jgi:hypothetical protein